jgi:YbbR domain-containing protein
MGLKKTLTEDLGVKILALVVALFIWFNASGLKEETRPKMIPISIENLPDSLVVTGDVPKEVKVEIKSTKRRLMWMAIKRRLTWMGIKPLTLTVDLSEAVPGRQRVSLSPLQIRDTAGIGYSNIRINEPRTLDLRLERLITKRLNVMLSTSGAIPEDLVLLDGAFSITPSWVSVTGPYSALERMSSVTTVPLDLTKIRGSFEKDLPIELSPTLLQCEPDHVTVSVTVVDRAERVLANVPPTVLIDSEDYTATVIPNTVALTVAGPRAVLDTLTYGDVSVLLNLGGLAEARYRMAPEVILPPGVVLTAMSVDSFVVDIVKNAKRR